MLDLFLFNYDKFDFFFTLPYWILFNFISIGLTVRKKSWMKKTITYHTYMRYIHPHAPNEKIALFGIVIVHEKVMLFFNASYFGRNGFDRKKNNTYTTFRSTIKPCEVNIKNLYFKMY